MTPKFSNQTIPFLKRAAKQRQSEWLEERANEYERHLKSPFVELALTLKQRLEPIARGYHFPTKGIGRIKRPSHKVSPGEPVFKDFLSLSIARPTGHRFERNPHLFFGILPNQPEWRGVIVAGGLYLPGSAQIRRVRLALERDGGAFDDVFKDRKFRARFKSKFSTEQKAVRVPLGFDPAGPFIEWIKLKRFYVYKHIPLRTFTSAHLADEVIADFTQLLRLNALLESALAGHHPPQVR